MAGEWGVKTPTFEWQEVKQEEGISIYIKVISICCSAESRLESADYVSKA